MHLYEIEIKSLLGSAEGAEQLRGRMRRADPTTRLISQNKQVNHYFVGGDINKLYESVRGLFPDTEKKRLEKIIKDGKGLSLRTRQVDNKVFLVIKASVDDSTSENGVARIEFESAVAVSLNRLDERMQEAGFSYQAKWSREREEYECKGTHVCVDRNAGYGYVAEFERVIDDENEKDEAQEELRALMDELGVEELPQDRLERMFAFYNEHWPEYYGTERVFVVD